MSTGSGALSGLPITWASRTEQPDGKTSPDAPRITTLQLTARGLLDGVDQAAFERHAAQAGDLYPGAERAARQRRSLAARQVETAAVRIDGRPYRRASSAAGRS